MRKFTKYPQGYVKADNIYKVSDNPAVYTNLNFGDMYAELDKQYATLDPNGQYYRQYINDSLDLHLRFRLITRAEAKALREKYLED